VVDHPQLDRPADRADDHLDGAAGGVAAGVVEQVGQHLVQSHRVDQHRRQLLGHVDLDPLPGGGPGPAHHRAHHLADRALDQPGVKGAGLDARHVEQVVDQPGQPVGLGVDDGQELLPLGVAPADLPVEQAGRRRLDRGQRGPQVVGDRVEQGGPQPVGLLQGHGPVALLLLLALLHGQGGLVGEGGQDPALGLAEPGRVGAAGDHHQRPDHVLATAHGDCQGPAGLQVGVGRPPDLHRGLGGPHPDKALVEVVGHLAVDRGQLDPVARGEHDRAPGQVEQRPHGADHALEGVGEAAVGDQAGRQVEQHAGLPLAPLGLGAPALAGRHQQADDDRDQQVDAERQVVLGVVDDQVVVGLEEQHVEGEEAEGGGGDAGTEAAGGGGRGHHQQVAQDHGGPGHLAPDGQERGGDQGRAAHGDNVAERATRPTNREPARDVHDPRIGRRPRKAGLDELFASGRPSFTASL